MSSVYLDIHHCGQRRYEYLELKVVNNATKAEDKKHNKDVEFAVKHIAHQREIELLSNKHNVEILQQNKPADFIAFAQQYIEENKERIQVRSFRASLKKFKMFVGKDILYCHEINEEFIQKFANYLDSQLTGLTPQTYLKKIRKLLKEAKKQRLIKFDFSVPLTISQQTNGLKDVLTFAELQLLINTPCGNKQVKNAFLFASLTGLRFCDVVALKWKNVQDDRIMLIQQKTKQNVFVPLNGDAKRLLGEQKKSNDNVFTLPSHTGCLKDLRNWVKRAGIEKHITFHCARHSFGTNLIEHGVDLFATSKLLGHTSVKHTLIYTRYSDKMGKEAIEKLPSLNLK